MSAIVRKNVVEFFHRFFEVIMILFLCCFERSHAISPAHALRAPRLGEIAKAKNTERFRTRAGSRSHLAR